VGVQEPWTGVQGACHRLVCDRIVLHKCPLSLKDTGKSNSYKEWLMANLPNALEHLCAFRYLPNGLDPLNIVLDEFDITTNEGMFKNRVMGMLFCSQKNGKHL
jgi:hypothetical protein